jgi:hypothetical protein
MIAARMLDGKHVTLKHPHEIRAAGRYRNVAMQAACSPF